MGSEISDGPLEEEGGEDSGDEGIGSATSEFKRDPPAWTGKIDTLLRWSGAVKFPVNVLAALTKDGRRGTLNGPDGKRKEIESVQEVCQTCDEELFLLRKDTITAVVPVSGLQRVSCCRGRCDDVERESRKLSFALPRQSIK